MYDKTIKVRLDKALGYEYFMDPEHPLTDAKGRVWMHRHVASLKVGRWISEGEVAHHVNHVRDDNRPENLEVMSVSDHAALHARLRRKPSEPRECPSCGKMFDPRRSRKKYCSDSCNPCRFSGEKPDRETLRVLIGAHSWCAIGRMFSVSDNAVRRWARNMDLI